MNRITLALESYSYAMNEEINTFRTNIQFAGDDKKVLLVTSCIQGEGKSGTALKLARSLTELKKRVLLIDADVRRSVFLKHVEGPRPEKGLTHFLSGQSTIQEVLCTTNIHGLQVIPAGPVPPNPTELFSTLKFAKLIEQARESYDYVIVDSAPLGMVVDAAILAKMCDAAILVIESENIKYRFAQNVKANLEETGCPILGAVLTKVKRKTRGRYYGKYYGKYLKDYE